MLQLFMGEKNGNQRIHLAKWLDIAKPKCWVVGASNTYIFGKSLATKNLRNLLMKDSSWKKLIEQKYISPDSLLD